MATHSNGISALQLQKQLGLGSYKSAWLLCAKLRRAMVAPDRAPLAGLVEVDETEIVCRAKDDPPTGGGGRSQSGQAAGGRRGRGAAPAGPAASGSIAIEDYRRQDPACLPRSQPRPRRHRQDRRLVRLSGRSRASTTSPTSSARWPPTSSCPGPTACSPTSRPGRSASTTACAARTSRPISTSSSSASIAAEPATPPSESLLGISLALKPATYNMLIAPEASVHKACGRNSSGNLWLLDVGTRQCWSSPD